MKVFWRTREAMLLLFTLIISTALSQEQRKRTVTESQIVGVVKRFRTSGSLSHEAKLKQIMECLSPNTTTFVCFFETFKTILIDEILLRIQMREMGEDCTSSGKYRKPFDVANLGVRAEYIRLQEELLDTGLTFCNPFKHLSCSPQKECECGPGTVLKPEVNPDVCTAIPGEDCLKAVPLFDPFNYDRVDLSTDIPSLQCSGSKSGQCGFASRSRDVCFEDASTEFLDKWRIYFRNSPRLSFGDPCNLEHHKVLLKPRDKDFDYTNYTIRVKKLKEIFEAKPQFCDLRRIFFCGNISRKCECVKPSFYDPNKKNCTYKHPNEYCTQNNQFYRLSETLIDSDARYDLRDGSQNIGIERECKSGCTNTNPEAGKVTIFSCKFCPRHEIIGRDCSKNNTLTLFLSAIPPPKLPIDLFDFGEQADILVELNEQATELEKSFVLDKGSPCDMEVYQESARAVRRIRNLEAEGTVPVITKEYYKQTTSFIQNFIRKLNGRRLCTFPWRELMYLSGGRFSLRTSPARPKLVCGPNATNSKCYEPSHDEYLEVLRKRLIPFQTIPDGQPCPLDVDQLFRVARGVFSQFDQQEEYYTFLIVTLETHYVNQTQFCDSKAFLECKLPERVLITQIGTCGKNMTNGDSNSGDLGDNAPRFIHLSFLVILINLYSV